MLRPLRGSNDGPKKRFSDKRLQELQAEGLNVAQIAKRLGVRRQAMSKLISEVGGPLRLHFYQACGYGVADGPQSRVETFA